jgi:hypothetical protein
MGRRIYQLHPRAGIKRLSRIRSQDPSFALGNICVKAHLARVWQVVGLVAFGFHTDSRQWEDSQVWFLYHITGGEYPQALHMGCASIVYRGGSRNGDDELLRVCICSMGERMTSGHSAQAGMNGSGA